MKKQISDNLWKIHSEFFVNLDLNQPAYIEVVKEIKQDVYNFLLEHWKDNKGESFRMFCLGFAFADYTALGERFAK